MRGGVGGGGHFAPVFARGSPLKLRGVVVSTTCHGTAHDVISKHTWNASTSLGVAFTCMGGPEYKDVDCMRSRGTRTVLTLEFHATGHLFPVHGIHCWAFRRPRPPGLLTTFLGGWRCCRRSCSRSLGRMNDSRFQFSPIGSQHPSIINRVQFTRSTSWIRQTGVITATCFARLSVGRSLFVCVSLERVARKFFSKKVRNTSRLLTKIQ